MQRRKWCGLIAVFFILTFWGASALAADDIVRVGVMEFLSKASGVTDQQADAIRDIFTRYLANSKSIAVLERERLLSAVGAEVKFGASGLVDPSMAVEIGVRPAVSTWCSARLRTSRRRRRPG
jgi:hypothetical protein